MSPEIVTELTNGFLCDNSLAALTIRTGGSVSPEEMIDLIAGARALYLMVTLESRNVNFIKEHREIWQEVLGVFREALQAWDGVENDAHVETLRRQLARLIELSEDRVSLYNPPEAYERKARKLQKADLHGFASFSER